MIAPDSIRGIRHSDGARQYDAVMNAHAQQTWFSNEDVAVRYGVSVATVRKWRNDRTGPSGVKFGRHVRYSIAELERWEREKASNA